ncbi:hypothetical protein [Variovorax saccharolyticus]|nr:hypothetical protein [Variovorax sp. J31P216]MDM0030435.1 hypothetical protein [Variovorax sp. J31P216]
MASAPDDLRKLLTTQSPLLEGVADGSLEGLAERLDAIPAS